MSLLSSSEELHQARDCLQEFCAEKTAASRVIEALAMVAHSSVGLGEVLQDYARQACGQLSELKRAAAAALETPTPADLEIIRNAHWTLKTACTVLNMLPAAMFRNKADTIGEKEKLSRTQIEHITLSFTEMPAVTKLLAAEDSGYRIAALLCGTDGELVAGPVQDELLHAAP